MKQIVKTSRLAGQLEKLFRALNEGFFDGQLETPIITIQSTPRAYGHVSVNSIWTINGEEKRRELNIGAGTLDIRLDKGEEVPCPQMLSASVCCRFFRNVLLKDPEAGTLEAGILSSGTKKHCAICGKEFYPAGNRAKYCADCKAGAQRKQQAEYARQRRASIKNNI